MFFSHNFGFECDDDTVNQYGFAMLFKPKQIMNPKGNEWIGSLVIDPMGKPRNVSRIICDVKLDTNCDCKDRSYASDSFADFNFDEGEWSIVELNEIAFQDVCQHKVVIFTLSIEIISVYDYDENKIEKAQWKLYDIE